MTHFRIEETRGTLVESVHEVSVAVVDVHGALVAQAGDPGQVTFWRSAAKPFQTLPLLQDGAADRYGLDDDDLAIATSSHSSEPFHLAAVDRFMAKTGVAETELACGPHPPLSPDVAQQVAREGITMSPRWSNCSGKHTGMVALTRHHGWAVEHYQRTGHPTQERLLAEICRWTSLKSDQVTQAIDGCTTVCFGLPLAAMALSYARLGTDQSADVRRLWTAITGRPDLIAGTRRLCTDLMRLWPGGIFAKVGADGVYSAAIPSLGVGLAIKVQDGDGRAVSVALVSVVRQLLERNGPRAVLDRLDSLADYGAPVVRNTRGETVGHLGAAGKLTF